MVALTSRSAGSGTSRPRFEVFADGDVSGTADREVSVTVTEIAITKKGVACTRIAKKFVS